MRRKGFCVVDMASTHTRVGLPGARKAAKNGRLLQGGSDHSRQAGPCLPPSRWSGGALLPAFPGGWSAARSLLTAVHTCAPAGLFRRSAAVNIFPADDRRRLDVVPSLFGRHDRARDR